MAYVSDGTTGLKIFDVTDPSTPALEGSYDTSSANDTVVDGNYAYIADGSDGLVILNISTPSNPTFVAQYNTAVYARDVEIVGNRAYVADNGGGLVIVDISTVTSPSLVTTYQPDNNNTAGVKVVDGLAYLAVNTDDQPQLRIVDVSNEQSISQVGVVTYNGIANEVIVVGNVAYLSSYSSGATFVDVLDPENPSVIGSLSSSSNVSSIAKDGDYFYMGESNQVEIADITELTSPTVVSTVTSTGTSLQTVSKGNYTYIAKGYSGIHIIDTNDTANPSSVTTYNVNSDYIRNVDVSEDGNYVFAVSDKHVYVIDVTDKSSPFIKRNNYYPQWGLFTSVKKRTILTRYASAQDLETEDLLLVTDDDNRSLHIFSFTSAYDMTHKKTVQFDRFAPNGSAYTIDNCETFQRTNGYLPDNNYSIESAIYVAGGYGGLIGINLNETNTSIAYVSYESDSSWSGYVSDVTTLFKSAQDQYLFISTFSSIGFNGVKRYQMGSTLFDLNATLNIATTDWAESIGNFNEEYIVVSNNEDGVFIFNGLSPDINYTIATDPLYQDSTDVSVNLDKNIAVSIEGRTGYGDAYLIDLKSLLP